MKKILCLSLILCLLFAVAACGKENETTDTDTSATEVTDTETEADTTGDTETKEPENTEPKETLAGGMTVEKDSPAYGETIAPDAD